MLNVSSNLGCCQAKPDGLPRIVRQSYAISRRLNMYKHNDTQVRQTNSLNETPLKFRPDALIDSLGFQSRVFGFRLNAKDILAGTTLKT